MLTDRTGGQRLVEDPRVALVSATGSVRMGREIAPVIAGRFGRSLLELGGNNGAIVAPSADLDLALRSIVFAAAGTAGQRCTTLRRLIVHRSILDTVVRLIPSVECSSVWGFRPCSPSTALPCPAVSSSPVQESVQPDHRHAGRDPFRDQGLAATFARSGHR